MSSSPSPTDTSTKKKQLSSIQRRGNKPLIEKRRRARINECLLQLKNLVLKATSSEMTRTGKLEKADILEMTVEYLKKINNNSGVAIKEETGSNYSAGYEKCMDELVQFLDKTKGFNSEMKQKITKHCRNKLHDRLVTSKLESVDKMEDDIVSTTNSRLQDDTSDSDSDSAMDTRPSQPTTPSDQSVFKDIKMEDGPRDVSSNTQSCSPITQNLSGSIRLVCGGDILILMDGKTNNSLGMPSNPQIIPVVSGTSNSNTIPAQNILIPYKSFGDGASVPTYNVFGASNAPVLPIAPVVSNNSPSSGANVAFPINVSNPSNPIINYQNITPVWRPW